MTAPATPPSPEDPQQPDPTTAEIAALLAALLLAGAAAGAATSAVAGTTAAVRALLTTFEARQIITILTRTGVSQDVAAATLGMTLARSPIPQTRRVAPAAHAARRANQTVNLQRRAAYLVQAAKRVQAAVVPPNVTPLPGVVLPAAPERLADALRQERAYFRQHVDAQKKRNAAARQVDDMAAIHGDQLSWRAVLDGKTSRYCRKADGTQFYASRMPSLGFPGTIHPACRCSAAAPKAGAKSTYDVPPIDD